MTIAESLPDTIAFARSLGDVCLIVAVIGCLFMLVSSACVLGFPVEAPTVPNVQPPVTVLKPLHDAEPGLRGRLAAFCRQHYGGAVQVLCGAQDRDSAAAAIVRALEANSPQTTVELVVDPRSHGVNRKVSNLINAMPRARHDTLVVSD